jgi:hypothetical protein
MKEMLTKKDKKAKNNAEGDDDSLDMNVFEKIMEGKQPMFVNKSNDDLISINVLVQSCGHVYSSEERDARVESTTLRPESRGTTRLDPRTILDCSRMHTTPRQTSTIGYWSTSDTAGVVIAMLYMLGKAGVMGALLTYS